MWIRCLKKRPGALLRLFCFPYAGAGPTLFNSWASALPEMVEVSAVQLPGRGSRLNEPLCRRLDPMVDSICAALVPDLNSPFALFGHSMGAILAFEVTRALAARSAKAPAHLFMSGRGAPHIPSKSRPCFDLSDDEFIAELDRLNGIPKELLNSREIMSIVLPFVRADFEATETYEFHAAPRVKSPITAFGGIGDRHVSREALEGWKDHTDSSFKLRMFPGDHFFIQSMEKLFLRMLYEDLLQTCRGIPPSDRSEYHPSRSGLV